MVRRLYSAVLDHPMAFRASWLALGLTGDHFPIQVPASSPKFLQASLRSPANLSDTIVYDLEDSVPLSGKEAARSALVEFINANPSARSTSPRLAIRINAINSGIGEDDIKSIFSAWTSEIDIKERPLPVIVVPKVRLRSPSRSDR